jgi:hypothetical protein
MTLGVWHDIRGQIWKPVGNRLARALCSSVRQAKNEETSKIVGDALSFWCLWSFHPRYHDFGKFKDDEKTMIGVFEDVYGPCASWKRNILPKLLLSELTAALSDLFKAVGDHCSAVQTLTQEFIRMVERRRNLAELDP